VPDDERFMMHDKPIRALAFSRDGELLASGAADGKVVMV
jgi:WD40 repeat protein